MVLDPTMNAAEKECCLNLGGASGWPIRFAFAAQWAGAAKFLR
jgi:hypothetical protein